MSKTEYDAEGRVTARVDAKGNRSQIAYDAAGRMQASTSPDGSTTSAGYCAGLASQPCAAVDALGNLTTTQVDSVGRVVGVADPLGRQRSQTYEQGGRLNEASGPNQPDTLYRYGGNGLLASSTEQGPNIGITVAYLYDARGNRTLVSTRGGGPWARGAGPRGATRDGRVDGVNLSTVQRRRASTTSPLASGLSRPCAGRRGWRRTAPPIAADV